MPDEPQPETPCLAGKDRRLMGHPERPSPWLVELVFIAAVVLYFLNIQSHSDSAILTLWLNIIFIVTPSFFIAVIIAWSFLPAGSWKVLVLGAARPATQTIPPGPLAVGFLACYNSRRNENVHASLLRLC
jgi:hypothetical protein